MNRRTIIRRLNLRRIEDTFDQAYADLLRREIHLKPETDNPFVKPPLDAPDSFLKNNNPSSRNCHSRVPPKGDANLAWAWNFNYHLTPHGIAAFVQANGPAVAGSSTQFDEGSPAQREHALVEVHLMESKVGLPGHPL